MAVIAMTRELATRGSEVALGLAERLGLDIIHHEVVEHDIAERAGMPESEVHRFLEGQASLWERWRIDRTRMSRYTAREILELAVKGNVLIRGWGATYLLKAIPHVLCVRICAPVEVRETVLMERLGLKDRATARREIERNDAAHNRTMQALFGIDWQDPALYAVVLNTDRVPVPDCIEHLVRIARSEPFRETERSRSALRDRLIEVRATDVLEQEFGQGDLRFIFDVTVTNGAVVLSGATTDSKLIAHALRLLQAIDGVQSVESRVSHIDFVPHAAG